MIVLFNYEGEYSIDYPNKPSRAMVLVLHPNFKGKLHGLNLDAISQPLLERLYEMVRKELKPAKLLSLQHELKVGLSGDPQQFYEQKIKRYLKSFSGPTPDQPYRTYIRKNVTNMKEIRYKFYTQIPKEKFKTKKVNQNRKIKK